ncbi:MAG: hypothetical protein ABI114_15680 [Rhodanobacter sp.]
MHILLTLKESGDGSWCICHEAMVLHDGLPFARAIKLARQLAHDLLMAPGDTVHLKLAGPEFATTILAHCMNDAVARPSALA